MQKTTITAKINKVENIPIDKIDSVLFNFRSEKLVHEDFISDDFDQLRRSITHQGILQPISVVANKNGTYSVVDGSRRLRIAKYLEQKEIRAYVLEGSQLELIATAISQNINRLNLIVEEETNAIIRAAKVIDKDITDERIKFKAKQIHNNSPNQDDDFKNLIEQLGFSANHIYQLFQVRVEVSSKATERANEINLPFRHRVLLTKGLLKITDKDKKPENEKDYKTKEQIQLDLIEQIKGQPVKRAQEIINHRINFIEQYKDLPDYDPDTNVLEGDELNDYARRREEAKDLPEIAKSATSKYIDMMVAVHEFIKCGTGTQLPKGRKFYKIENVKHTEDFRKEIVEDMPEPDCKILLVDLNLAGHVIDSFTKMIYEKYPKDLDQYK